MLDSLRIAVLLIAFAQPAFSQDCNEALRQSVFASSSEYHSDWRLYQSLTTEEYQQKSTSAGADAVISGIPMGGSYDSHRENMSRYESIYEESLSQSQLQNIYWTGLDDNTRIAYEACLEANSFGLLMAPREATSSSVEVVLKYRNPDPQAQRLPLTWSGDTDSLSLPSEIGTGEVVTFVVPRPQGGAERLLSVFGGGVSQGLTFTSLPRVITLPDFNRFRVSLKNGAERLSSDAEISEITYRHVGSTVTSPDTHEFQFVVKAGGNSERYNFTVDQSRSWQDQLRIYDIGTGYLEITFTSYNDGVGDMVWRIHPKS